MSVDISFPLTIEKIQKFLPHRSPFLLVDRILEISLTGDPNEFSPSTIVGTKVVGLKSVSYNEPFFQGHFPTYPIMPGVLQIETMAQVASFSIYPYLARDLERLAREFQCILVGVDGVRFRKPVIPGDTLRIETVVSKCRGRLWAFECATMVDGQKVAEAEILANLIANSDATKGFGT